MPNSYKYLDPDYTYADPQTGVMRNLHNITDRGMLIDVETLATEKRAKELEITPIQVSDSSALFAIHRHLFQDIYKWAGEERTVEISKSGRGFFPRPFFNQAKHYIDNLITEYKKIEKENKPTLSQKLAEILDAVNHFHPFREGNGRAQREFIRVLALEKGYKLNLNPPDDAEVYERYMTGTVNGDVDTLARLIFERLSE